MKQRYNVRPGKGQSMFGFVVGIVFVFIGLGFLQTMGGFGVIWLLVAIGITVMHGINAFTEKGVPTHRVDVTTTSHQIDTEQTSNTSNSFDEKLRKLHKLKQEGILTDEEYEVKKQQILNEEW